MRAKGRLMTMQAMTGKTEGRHSTLDEVLAMETGAQATVHGLVHTLRDLGDVRFALLRMPQGVLQCVLGAEEDVRDGDAVTVSGEAVRDERAPGGVELHAQRVKVLSRAAEAMPVPIGKNKMNLSLDTDLSLRFVTLRNLRKRAVFKIQEGIVRGFREALQKEDFTEIHSRRSSLRTRRAARTCSAWNTSAAARIWRRARSFTSRRWCRFTSACLKSVRCSARRSTTRSAT